MTNPTPHGQVPEALIDLIDAYAETRHRCGGIYNARTEAARNAVIEALSEVQALSAAPAGFVPVAAFDRLHAHAESLAARLLAATPTPPAEQAAPKAAQGDAIDEAMRERDDAEDFIDALLDEVLGHERPEWSNLYGRANALNDVQERMASLHKPAVDKAWGQFQSAMAAPQQEAQEPFAWESTTPGYIKYITQARYEKFSPNVQRWYKPYRCSGCAERGAGFDACDMATAAAQGFRRGQAAAKQEG